MRGTYKIMAIKRNKQAHSEDGEPYTVMCYTIHLGSAMKVPLRMEEFIRKLAIYNTKEVKYMYCDHYRERTRTLMN